MSHLDDSAVEHFYQFPRWSTPLTRSHTALPAKKAANKFKLIKDNRNQIENLSRCIIRPNIQIATQSRVHSPPPLYQPTPTPDIGFTNVQASSNLSNNPSHHLRPLRIKSATLTVPAKTSSEEISLKNFPKQSHERRQIMQQRKRQKQQTLRYIPTDSDTWFQLRESLAELKRLATTEEVLIDPSTSLFSCDGYSFQALKRLTNQQFEQKKMNKPKYELGW